MAPWCPRCGKQAPIVYRGVVPYCTACGALRAPLSSPSVNLAGKSSRVGGTFASVMGWLVLVCGGSLALAIALLFMAFNVLGVGLAIAIPMAIVVLVVGIALLHSGKSLSTSGLEAERTTRDQALLAMAAHHGAVRAEDAARALGIGSVEADAMLTELAKREPDRVAVDVDDQGVVWYRVSSAPGEPIPHMRVSDGLRVEAASDRAHAPTDDVDPVESKVATRSPR